MGVIAVCFRRVDVTLSAFSQRLANVLQPKPPIDARAGRLVAVIECVFNQNARDAGAATYAAMNRQLIDLCHAHDVGILQLPCPEIACLGFQRKRPAGRSIRQALDTDSGRRCCAKIGADAADRLANYAHVGYRIVAVLGGNQQSPGCAVHDSGTALQPESGVLMRELQTELRKRGLEIPFRGLRDADTELLAQDLDWLRAAFAAAE